MDITSPEFQVFSVENVYCLEFGLFAGLIGNLELVLLKKDLFNKP